MLYNKDKVIKMYNELKGKEEKTKLLYPTFVECVEHFDLITLLSNNLSKTIMINDSNCLNRKTSGMYSVGKDNKNSTIKEVSAPVCWDDDSPINRKNYTTN